MQYSYDPMRYKPDMSGIRTLGKYVAETVEQVPGWVEEHEKELQSRDFKKNSYKKMATWINAVKKDKKIWEGLKKVWTRDGKPPSDEELYRQYKSNLPNPSRYEDHEKYKQAVIEKTVGPLVQDINKVIRDTNDPEVLDRAYQTIAPITTIAGEKTEKTVENIKEEQQRMTSQSLMERTSRAKDPQKLRNILATAKAQGLEDTASAIETLLEGAKDPLISQVYAEVAENYQNYSSYEEAFSDVMGKFSNQGLTQDQAETIRTAISKLPTELEKTKTWIANMLRKQEVKPSTAADVGGYYKKRQNKQRSLKKSIESERQKIENLQKKIEENQYNPEKEDDVSTWKQQITAAESKIEDKRDLLEGIESATAVSATQLNDAVKFAQVLVNPQGKPLVDNTQELYNKVKSQYPEIQKDKDAWSSFLESLNQSEWWKKSSLSPGIPEAPSQEPQEQNFDERMGL